MKRILRSAVPLVVALPLLAGCSPRTAPSTLTVDERSFSFQVPRDWFPAAYDQQAKAYAPAKGHQAGTLKPEGSLLYAAPSGDYLYLEFDPLGHGLEYDLEWTVEPRDDRFVLLQGRSLLHAAAARFPGHGLVQGL